ncbi:MAG: glycosyltransferase [bacterium]
MRNILFTTPVLEHPAAGGPQLRIENSIKALNDICQLHVISRVSYLKIGGNVADKYYRKNSYKFFYSPAVKINYKNIFFYKIKKAIKLFSDKRTKYCLDDYLVDIDAKFIVNYAKKNNIDVIWFGYGNISYNLIDKIKKINSKLILICDTDSVFSRFILRGLPYHSSEKVRLKVKKSGLKKAWEEEQLVQICDVITAVSEVDRDYYLALTGEKEKVFLFSNVIDVDIYNKKVIEPDKFKRPSVYLAGSYGKDSPMEHAVRWFIDLVFPILKKKNSNIHFYIVGTGSKETLRDIKDSNITITGKLESVLPYLCNVDVAIVPLFFESGTRFKILEAGAAGTPIVSTTLGAEGLDVTDGKDILIADEPVNFANAILKLIDDKEYSNKLAMNCKKLIREKYGIDSLKKEAIDILNYCFSNENYNGD